MQKTKGGIIASFPTWHNHVFLKCPIFIQILERTLKEKLCFVDFCAHEVQFQCSIKDRNQLENPLFLIANGKVCFNSSAVGKMYEFNVEGNGSIKSVQAGTFT